MIKEDFKNLNNLATKLHEETMKKGFYEEHRQIGTLLMLIVSELGEALEAERRNKKCPGFNLIETLEKIDDSWEAKEYISGTGTPAVNLKNAFETTVKDTFEDEIADALIRLLDLVGYLNIDIEKHAYYKMKYNDTRPYKHGKKF